MRSDDIVLLAEHNDRDVGIIEKGLELSGVDNRVIRFSESSEVLDFLFGKLEGGGIEQKNAYVLFMDVDMPNGDAPEILGKIKSDSDLKMIPVIIFGTKDDSETVEFWHSRGCSMYLVKPGGSEDYSDAVRKVGSFLSVVEIPRVSM